MDCCSRQIGEVPAQRDPKKVQQDPKLFWVPLSWVPRIGSLDLTAETLENTGAPLAASSIKGAGLLIIKMCSKLACI